MSDASLSGADDVGAERFPVRAFVIGSLTGPVLVTFGISAHNLMTLLQEFAIYGLGDFFAAFFFLLLGAAFILGISFPFGGFAAMACLQFLIWLERRASFARSALVWAVIGTLFALPVAWFFTPSFGGDLGPFSDSIFVLIAACGATGGFLARFAYYGRLPHISSRNSSSTAR